MALHLRRLFAPRLWILLVLFLLAVHFALTFALGHYVQKIFADGTGCSVQLTNPKLSYLPFYASVENVKVYCPEEGPKPGFSAKKLQLDISTEMLTEGVVLLEQLEISGARVISLGEESALFRVVDFLFGKEAKQRRKNSNSPIKIWLPNTVITTEGRDDPLLIIGLPEAYVQFRDVTFTARDPQIGPEHPAQVEAEGSEGSFVFLDEEGEQNQLFLGEFFSAGELHKGTYSSARTRLSDPESESTVSAGGEIAFEGAEAFYAVNAKGKVASGYLAKVLREVSPELSDWLKTAELAVATQVKLSGPLDSPALEGDVSAIKAASTRGENCPGSALTTAFRVDRESLSLRDLTLAPLIPAKNGNTNSDEPATGAEVLKITSAELALDEAHSISSTAALRVGPKMTALTSCLFEHSQGLREAVDYVAAAEGAFSGSQTEIQLQGRLQPLQLSATTNTGFSTGVSAEGSQLTGDVLLAELSLDEKQLGLQLTEQLRFPAVLTPNKESETLGQTAFRSASSASLAAELRLDFQNQQLAIEEFSFENYPAGRMISHLAPVLDETASEKLASNFKSSSLLNFELLQPVSFSSPDSVVEDLPSGRLARASASDVQAGPLLFEKIQSDFRKSGSTISTEGLSLKTENGSIEGSVEYLQRGALAMDLKANSLAISGDSSLAKLLEGKIQFSLSGVLGLEPEIADRYELNLTAFTRPRDFGPGERGAPAEQERSTLSIKTDGQDQKLTADLFEKSVVVEGSISDGEVLNLDAAIQSLSLASFTKPASSIGRTSISGEAQYLGPLSEPMLGKGRLLIDEVDSGELALALREGKPIELLLEEGRLSVRSAALALGGRHFEVSGSVAEESGWDLRMDGSWILASFSALVPELDLFDGELSAALQVTGAIDSPELRGAARLQKGVAALSLGQAELNLSEVTATARFEGDNAYLDQLDGRIGSGSFTGSGSIENVLNPDARTYDLQSALSKVELRPYENLFLLADADLRLQKALAGPPRLSGEVKILEAFYEQRLNLGAVLRDIAATVAGKKASSASSSISLASGAGNEEALQLDIQVRSDSGLIVETDIAEAQLQADVQLLGEFENPAVEGTVRAEEGNFKLGANQFDLILGRLDFSKSRPAWDPRVELTAESQIASATREEHLVRLSVLGPLSQPRIRFTSDSGLSESEIVAMFGLGSGGLTIFSNASSDRSITELFDPTSKLSLQERPLGSGRLFRGAGRHRTFRGTRVSSFQKSAVAGVLLGESHLSVQSELSNRALSQVDINYPITSNLSAEAGWRSRAVTENQGQSTGSYSAGFRFRETFSGTSLLPGFGAEEREEVPAPEAEDRPATETGPEEIHSAPGRTE